jgi:hypothetical protein
VCGETNVVDCLLLLLLLLLVLDYLVEKERKFQGIGGLLYTHSAQCCLPSQDPIVRTARPIRVKLELLCLASWFARLPKAYAAH